MLNNQCFLNCKMDFSCHLNVTVKIVLLLGLTSNILLAASVNYADEASSLKAANTSLIDKGSFWIHASCNGELSIS